MRPESFDEDLRGDWDTWVLDYGLPDLPPEPVIGESVPIARWAGARFGSVLHVTWDWGVAEDEDQLRSEVQVYRRVGSSWEPSSGCGGTDWFSPPFVRPAAVGPYDAVVGHVHESGDGNWRCRSVDGFAGSEAATVEVLDAEGVTARPIESQFGVFIACWDASDDARLRIIARNGRCILDQVFSR